MRLYIHAPLSILFGLMVAVPVARAEQSLFFTPCPQRTIVRDLAPCTSAAGSYAMASSQTMIDDDEPARLPTLITVGYHQAEFPLVAPAEPLPPAAQPSIEPSNGDSCTSCSDEVSLPHACRACDRWYVSFSGGTASRETVHEIDDARTFIEFDTGFAANLALGYRFDVFRAEAEYSFMNNDCAQAGAGGLASGTVGNVNLRALMFNLYHDIQISDWCWSPYVGAGIGVYQSEINGLYPDFFNTIGAPFVGVPVNATSDIPLAYQFRVGASRPVGERTDFFAGYRYFHGETLTFSSAPFASFAPTFSPDAAAMHNVEFGLRVRF